MKTTTMTVNPPQTQVERVLEKNVENRFKVSGFYVGAIFNRFKEGEGKL